jgi:hypothetical protein
LEEEEEDDDVVAMESTLCTSGSATMPPASLSTGAQLRNLERPSN